MADTTGDLPDQLIDWGEDLEAHPDKLFDDRPMITVSVEPQASQVMSPPEPARSRRGLPTLVTVLLSALVGATTASAVLVLTDDPGSVTTTAASPATTIAVTSGVPSSVTAVAARVIPSIVTVEVSTVAAEEFTADASGSGVVLDATGTVVTNEHVVEGAAAIRVVFADGRTYDATLLGADALTDLAVLDIAAEGLTPITIGSSRTMSIGDPTIAIGSPLGLEGGPSVTVGVLSAFERSVGTGQGNRLFGMLQTDAPITRGSSGGALVDSEGRLIGITSAIGVSDVGAEGLGFAIPVEMMQRITADLIAEGRSLHPFLGISGSTFFETRPDGALAPAGVEVGEVIAGTAAELGGLAVGDVIVSFDDETVITMDRLVVALRYLRVGETVRLDIIRAEQPLTLEVVLLERPEGT